MVIDRSGDPAGVTAGALHFWTATVIGPSSTFLAMWTWPGAASVVARYTHTVPSSEYTALELTAAIPQTGETAGYFWETVTLPGGTTYLHPDQLTVLDQAGHPLCTYDLTNHWGYASSPPLGNEVIDMTPYRDYTQAVCSCLRHATAEEKQAVAQETPGPPGRPRRRPGGGRLGP